MNRDLILLHQIIQGEVSSIMVLKMCQKMKIKT